MVFQIRAIAALDPSVMSDDINADPEVEAVLESNHHQQIVLFLHISINGLDEDRGVLRKTQWR